MAGTAESGPQRTSRSPLGEVNDPNAPALGQHFWLDVTPSQIDALSVPEWQKIILRAMAKYGMYVGDNGGAPWALQFESGDNYTSFGKPDPWVDYAQSHRIQGLRLVDRLHRLRLQLQERRRLGQQPEGARPRTTAVGVGDSRPSPRASCSYSRPNGGVLAGLVSEYLPP